MAMFKLGYFVLERVAEPLSRSIEALARQSPLFRRGCVSLARGFERRQAERHNRFLKPGEALQKDELSDEQAIQKGAELLGEGILWVSGISIVLHQTYNEEKEEDEKVVAHDVKRKASEVTIIESVLSAEKRIMDRIDHLNRRLDQLLGEEPSTTSSSTSTSSATATTNRQVIATSYQQGVTNQDKMDKNSSGSKLNNGDVEADVKETFTRNWWKWY
jgi:hypothetical protein